MHDGSLLLTRLPLDVHLRHQLIIAGVYGMAIHGGLDAVACHFLHLADPAGIKCLVPCRLQGLGNGMIGINLRQGGHFQQSILADFFRMNGRDSEDALGQRAGFVKHDRIQLRQQLHIVGTLHQYALLGCTADAAEEGQRHGNHQSAGAGDDQESQGTMKPLHPVAVNQRRNDRQQQRCTAHRRSIHTCKPGNEPLRLCLVFARRFHQVQNAADGGFAVAAGDTHRQQAGQVDTAANHAIPFAHVTGQGLAGQCRGIQAAGAGKHHAIQRHTLTGMNANRIAYAHFIRGNLHFLAILHQDSKLRANIHQGRNGRPTLVHCPILEPFTHLIEGHNRYTFSKFADAHGTNRGHSHQKVFIKNLAVRNIAKGTKHHIIAGNQIADDEQYNAQPSAGERATDEQSNRHGRTDEDDLALTLLFLMLLHMLMNMMMLVIVTAMAMVVIMIIVVIVIIVIMVMMIMTAAAAIFMLMFMIMMVLMMLSCLALAAVSDDSAVRLHLFAAGHHLCQHLVINIVRSFQGQRLVKEVHTYLRHAGKLRHGVFHLGSAVGTVQIFQGPGFLHEIQPPNV